MSIVKEKQFLIAPHGGKLINRFAPEKQAVYLKQNKNIKSIVATPDILLDLENIGVGVYSPLEGFMTEEEFQSVVNENQLLNGLPWTIPVALALDSKIAKDISVGQTVILKTTDDIAVGCLQVSDRYKVNKTQAAEKIYGTSSEDHPGVQKFYTNGDVFLGGKIWLFKKNAGIDNCTTLEPVESRAIIEERGWKTVAGFQTRNVPHRAHEYLQKHALSVVDGLFVHPIIGWKKKGDFRPEVVMEAYNVLLEHYYPQGRYLLSGFTTAMRYAGPKEAVFHAIIRKNFGCTHFVVGRDHAGVGGFYDKYAAHRIFDEIPDLGVTPLLLRGPYYCKKCVSIVNDTVCPHSGTEFEMPISATDIRDMISKNRKVTDKFFRKEVSEFVNQKGKDCFI